LHDARHTAIQQPGPDHPPPYLIDALNVAYWAGRPASLRLPLALLHHWLSQGRSAQLVFDASARHQLQHEAACYLQLLHRPEICLEVPAGRTADGALLRQARATGACIISRDHYSDHRRRYRKLIDEPGRVLAGWVKDDQLHLPALACPVPLAPSAGEAWARCCTLLPAEPVTAQENTGQ
jgi:hypothetical protein